MVDYTEKKINWLLTANGKLNEIKMKNTKNHLQMILWFTILPINSILSIESSNPIDFNKNKDKTRFIDTNKKKNAIKYSKYLR